MPAHVSLNHPVHPTLIQMGSVSPLLSYIHAREFGSSNIRLLLFLLQPWRLLVSSDRLYFNKNIGLTYYYVPVQLVGEK